MHVPASADKMKRDIMFDEPHEASAFRLRRSSLFISFLLLLTISCGSSPNVPLEYVHYRLNTNPTTLDPALIVDVTGGMIAAKLFNGLVRLDDNLQVIPDIAESWEISPDGTVYTFHLRKDVCFSDGLGVTAEDFEYSFRRVLSPHGRSPNTWVLDRIAGAHAFMTGAADSVEGIQALGVNTLRLRLERPFSPFLRLLTMTAAYVVPRKHIENISLEFSSNPIGTGPFILKKWEQNSDLVLERSTRYFGEQAKVKGLIYHIIPEDLTALVEFELGNIDVISIPAAEHRRFQRNSAWKEQIVAGFPLNTYYLGFNCSRPPFDKKELRKAVFTAIDREKILNTYYEARGVLASGPVPEALRAWKPPALPAYNPEVSRIIVSQMNMVEKSIDFYIVADQEVVDIAEIIQSYLENIGLSVRIRQLEWSAYKEALNRGEADMYWISWWADYPDPENFLFPLFHSSNLGAGGNRSRYSNELVDHFIEKGQAAMITRERNAAYQRAEWLIADDLPWVFFWHRTDFLARQARIKGLRSYPVYSMDKGTDVSL